VSKIIWTDRAKEQLRAIDREQALGILHALTDYAESGKGQIKKLKGSGDLRLRVRDYPALPRVSNSLTRVRRGAPRLVHHRAGFRGTQLRSHSSPHRSSKCSAFSISPKGQAVAGRFPRKKVFKSLPLKTPLRFPGAQRQCRKLDRPRYTRL